MLGRALAAEAKTHESETFRPVEVAFVSSGRTACVQAEPVVEANGLADIAIELQDALARLEHMGVSASALVGVLCDARGRLLGRKLREQRQSLL